MKKSLFLLTIVIFLIIITIIIYKYPDLRENKINEYNNLASDLDQSQIDINSFKSSNFLSKFKNVIAFENKLENLPNLKDEKENIIINFDTKISDYIEALQEYKFINQDFLPNDLDSIDFKTKRNADEYLKTLKSQFKENIITYNESNENIYFEIDPEVELNSMSLEEKVGQLFIFAFRGESLSENEKEFIEKYHLGGYVLLGENILDESQLISLTNEIQEQKSNFPLFISVDQEGGIVKRILWDNTLSQKELSNKSLGEVCSEYKLRDELLFNLGINWNFGIVADVTESSSSFIYPRTFNGDYIEVAEKVNEAINCSTKTITTLKHFPGHGATELDTHLGLATINKSKDAWENEDLVPFIQSNSSDSIMIGHLILEFLDTNPASLSKEVHSYIRNEMNYNGIIITDDLRMLESASYTKEEALEQALINDNDILLYSYNDSIRNEIIEDAIELVKTGRVTEEEINQKLIRIFMKKNSIIKNENNYIPKELIY